MKDKTKTAAVGEYSSIVLFGAAGVTTYPVNSTAEAEAAISKLVKQGFEVIFLTERLAAEMEELLEQYRRSAFPLILPIPDRNGSTGYSMKHLTANMEKAIGTNIFDKN